MAEILNNYLILAKVYCRSVEQLGINTYQYRLEVDPGGPVTTDLNWAEAFADLAEPLYTPLLSAEAAFRGVSAQLVRNDAPQTIHPTVFSSDRNSVGLVAGEILPRMLSGVIGRYTETAGPAGRGRAYVPFPGEADSITPGVPTADYIDRLEALAIGLMNPAGVTMGVPLAHVTIHPVLMPRPTPDTAKPIILSVARGAWGAQRRRGGYGAGNPSPYS